METSKKLNPNQLQAVTLLASGVSSSAIADQLKVTRETVSRWRAQPEFQDELDRLLFEARRDAQERLLALSGLAVETIEKLLRSPQGPIREKVSASFRVLRLVADLKLKPREPDSEDDEINRQLHSWVNSLPSRVQKTQQTRKTR